MAVKSYLEKLKDPRWQKKRLEILNRDNFTCQTCKDDKSTLHVHHTHYSKGREPWEATEDCLITLCERCHKEEHITRSYWEESILLMMKIQGWTFNDLHSLFWMIVHDKKDFMSYREYDFTDGQEDRQDV